MRLALRHASWSARLRHVRSLDRDCSVCVTKDSRRTVACPGFFFGGGKKLRENATLNFFLFCSIKTSKNQIVNVAGQIARSKAKPNDSSPDAVQVSPEFVANARKEAISFFDIPFPLNSSFVGLE